MPGPRGRRGARRASARSVCAGSRSNVRQVCPRRSPCFLYRMYGHQLPSASPVSLTDGSLNKPSIRCDGTAAIQQAVAGAHMRPLREPARMHAHLARRRASATSRSAGAQARPLGRRGAQARPLAQLARKRAHLIDRRASAPRHRSIDTNPSTLPAAASPRQMRCRFAPCGSPAANALAIRAAVASSARTHSAEQ